MKITRRQFSFGVLLGAVALLFGRLFGLGRSRGDAEKCDGGVTARYWRPGKHLAGMIILAVIVSSMVVACSSDAKETVQQPVVAGMFYPGDKATLKMMVERDLKAAPVKKLKGHLVALIAPHAGYRYSGKVAGYAFKQLENRKYKTVVVIAPSHRMPLRGAALSTRDVYRTPLGDIPIAKDVVKRMIKKYAWAEDDQRPFKMEHSLEVELPFLQVMLKDFKVVPIIVGTHDKAILNSIAQSIHEELPGDDVLVVASTDLSHYKPYDEAVKVDKKTLGYIERGDCEAFLAAEKTGKVLACGAGPTYIAMKIWKLKGGGDIEVLQYLNSGDTAGDKSKVVGYAAIALLTKGSTRYEVRGAEYEKQTPPNSEFTLTESEKETLLKLAHDTVMAHVSGKKLPPIKTDNPKFKANGATFVTLRKDGHLRGCIGHIIAREPLIENVRNMAIQASSHDPRFPPVRKDELKDIDVEVSVLTPPQPLLNPLEVRVGTDGLIIQRGFNRGVLLPQVPTEQGWNKDQYLRGICRKAGMEPTCWKDAKLKKFQAIVFGE
jgi:AmmeMemoRadiSam system protein B/AmmeMemoRadiSam system protein A